MLLFQKTKNLLFESMVDLVNDMIAGRESVDGNKWDWDMVEKRLMEFMAGSGYNLKESARNSLKRHMEAVKETSFFLTLNDGSLYPVIEEKVPAIPTEIEVNAFWEMLSDPTMRLMLPDEISSMEKKTFVGEGSYLYRNKPETDDCGGEDTQQYRKLKRNLSEIMKAVMFDKKIRYTNFYSVDAYKKGESVTKYLDASPYRLLYSPRVNRLQLIVRPDGEGTEKDRGVVLNVERLYEVECLDEPARAGLEDWYNSPERKKPLVLQIFDSQFNTVDRYENMKERCFSLFSHLDKSARYNEEEKCFEITVKYYIFNEEDIIKDIMSLGSYVMIKEPIELRERHKKEINQTLSAIEYVRELRNREMPENGKEYTIE